MIDPSLLTAKDFIGVRASLIAALGNDANRAVVLTRIYWRTLVENRDTHERDGQLWWRATYQTLADHTGLTVNQVKRIVPWLVEKGYVETREFRLDGITDRTLSMRVVTSMAESHSRSADPHLDMADSHSQGSADSHSLPSTKKEDTLSSDRFDEFWSKYPRRIAKAPAMKAWKAAVKKTDADTIISGAVRYAASVASSEERFIAHPATWLNGERWLDGADVAVEVVEERPTKRMTLEERRAYYAAEHAAEQKRLEEMSRNAKPTFGRPVD